MEGSQFLSMAIAIVVGIFVLGTILSGFFRYEPLKRWWYSAWASSSE